MYVGTHKCPVDKGRITIPKKYRKSSYIIFSKDDTLFITDPETYKKNEQYFRDLEYVGERKVGSAHRLQLQLKENVTLVGSYVAFSVETKEPKETISLEEAIHKLQL